MPPTRTIDLDTLETLRRTPPSGGPTSGTSAASIPIPEEPTKCLRLNPDLVPEPGVERRRRSAAFIGPLGIGKDHAAGSLGFKQIVKIAGSLYKIVEDLWGDRVDKRLAGWRETLCKVGAWGRGEVTPDYPVTPERLLLVRHAREHGYPGFGRSKGFWLDEAFERFESALYLNGEAAITDIRYPNELDRALEEEVPVWFVACRPWVLDARRQRSGYALHNVGDASERMANEFYQRVTISRLPLQSSVRVLWSDTPESCPDFATPLFLR